MDEDISGVTVKLVPGIVIFPLLGDGGKIRHWIFVIRNLITARAIGLVGAVYVVDRERE